MGAIAAWMAGVLSVPAHAFCGTYVGSATASLTNQRSRIAIAREARATTLTMFSDVQGDLTEFALIVPVPDDFDRDNVRLADHSLLDRIETYSAPREVSYTCADLYKGTPRSPSSGCGGSSSTSDSSSGCGFGGDGGSWFDSGYDIGDDGWTDTGWDVEVEDEFDVGEYTAYVLDAEGADGLLGWLGENGFAVGTDMADVFQEYIDAGQEFLALKVDLDDAPVDATWLTPVQIGYRADAWTLPLRMGTLNSAGVQDLTLYALTGNLDGRVAISNYPETSTVDNECLLPEDGESAADWYDGAFAAATGLPSDPLDAFGASGFAWVTEYSWGTPKGSLNQQCHCDPCPPVEPTEGGPLTGSDVVQFGLSNATVNDDGYHVTRLHLRYTPDAVPRDPSFYASGVNDKAQFKFVTHTWELESAISTCGGEEPADPGSCYSAEWWARRAQDKPGTSSPVLDPGGCHGLFAILLPLPLALLRRRRP